MVSVDEVRARLAAATPRPWKQNGRNGIHTVVGACVALSHSHDDDKRKADATFIANAPTDIEFLLTLLDERDAQIAAVREVCADPRFQYKVLGDFDTYDQWHEGASAALGYVEQALDAKGGAS